MQFRAQLWWELYWKRPAYWKVWEWLCCLHALKIMMKERHVGSLLWNTGNEPNLHCSDPYWQRNMTTPSDLSFLLFSWSACEITPQVVLSGNFDSAVSLPLRVKLRLKEQEPWKTVFPSSSFLSFRDITTRARVSSSSSFSDFRNLSCVWKSCSVRWKDFSFFKFSENEYLRYYEIALRVFSWKQENNHPRTLKDTLLPKPQILEETHLWTYE